MKEGLVEVDTFRFNLRSSNTEPVVRLNVEARGDADLVVKDVKRVTHSLLAEDLTEPANILSNNG